MTLTDTSMTIVIPPSGMGWQVTDGNQTYRVIKSTADNKYRCSCGTPLCPHIMAVIRSRVYNSKISTQQVYPPGPVELNGEGSVEEASIGQTTQSDVKPDDSLPLSPETPLPSPNSQIFNVSKFGPLPSWVESIRPHQWQATEEIIEGYKRGSRVVWLDAPTGSGKSLLGEMVRRIAGDTALYVCSGKTLQTQFMNDFAYASLLQGKGNYTPNDTTDGDISCADCTKSGPDDDCNYCEVVSECPYPVAKSRALRSPLAVLNTSYLFAEANGPGRFSGRGLGVLDECDVLEQELMSYVEFNLGFKALQDLRVSPPKKGSHYTTIMKWVRDTLKPAAVKRHAELKGVRGLVNEVDVRHMKKVRAAENLVNSINAILRNVGEDIDGANWVRDNDAGPLVLKPVTVNQHGQDVIWRHAERWLCMSATIVSAEMMSESLGLEEPCAGDETATTIPWAGVSVPMTFPVTNRPIYQIPIASMTNREKETSWPKMVQGIKAVLDMPRHQGQRVLIHTVSYKLAEYLKGELRNAGVGNRELITYKGSADRENAIERYRRVPGAVIIAPSLDRGVDFKHDDCRVVIIAKMPFPYLGDPQVSRRMNGPNGKMWYNVQTVRSVIQMTGRHVRSADDWGVTYVLDSQFGSNVFKRCKGLFPEYWRDAVEFRRGVDLLEGNL